MSSLTQYRPFFSVEVLIDYYLTEEAALYQNTLENPMNNVLLKQHHRYRLEDDLLIVPTAETRSKLKDYRMIFKRDQRGFFVAGQVNSMGDGTFVPFTEFNEPISLSFAVFLQNAEFYNFTNLRLEQEVANKDHFLYYFTNRSNNVVNNEVLYLTGPMPGFDAGYAYEASELYIDNTDPLNPAMMEAIENNGPGALNAANWREIFNGVDTLFQFVTNTDRIVCRPSVFKHDVSDVAEEQLRFVFSDANSNPVKSITKLSPETGTPLFECELDLDELPSGYYEMTVADGLGTPLPQLNLVFFKDDSLFKTRPLGLIECVHEPGGSLGEYRWLDHTSQNRLRSPLYTIRWKNRSTWWRYYHEEIPDLTSPMLEHLDPNVASPNHRILITTSPIALTQLGREVAVTTGTGDLKLMPNPVVKSIFPENGRIFSELNMGGGFGPPE